MDFSAAFKKQKRCIWLVSALFVLGGGYIASMPGYLGKGFPYGVFLGAVLLGIAVYLTLRRRKTPVSFEPDADATTYVTLFDRYSRRSVNWVLVSFWATFGLVLNCVSLGVNSKASEVLETVYGNLLLLEAVAFFSGQKPSDPALAHRPSPL